MAVDSLNVQSLGMAVDSPTVLGMAVDSLNVQSLGMTVDST